MNTFRRASLLFAAMLLSLGTRGVAQLSPGGDEEAVRALLSRLEQVMLAGQPDSYLDLLSESADRTRATNFATTEFRSKTTRVVILEREREVSTRGGFYRLIVDVFIESGDRARVATWLIDVARLSPTDVRISDQERLSAVEGLYRLSLNPTRQFRAKDFRITSEDLKLTLADGSVFTVDTDQGVTGLVLTGRGQVVFRPRPDTEKAQMKIFAGSETLATRFDSAFVRVGDLAGHADLSTLIDRPVSSGDFRRADQVFREESTKAYVLDLADLTEDTWSFVPPAGDLVAEIRTRRFGTITYSHAASEPEDIALFSRDRHQNIAIYGSQEKLEKRGRFYHEDDLAEYDVLDYDIELSYSPEFQWIDALAKIRLRTRSTPTGQLTLSLADALDVQSVNSTRFGRLFALRAPGQNVLVINLPATLLPGTDETLTISYRGRLAPQPPNREVFAPAALAQDDGRPETLATHHDVIFPQAEPSFLYSNRTLWYPQGRVSDYATATIRISVPSSHSCVASGTLAADSPLMVPGSSSVGSRKLYTFVAPQPLRYLSFIISRFTASDKLSVTFSERGTVQPAESTGVAALPEGANFKLDVSVQVNPRQTARARGVAAEAGAIARFYHSLIGHSPYPSLDLALIENTVPGGHSPAYFIVLDVPIPGLSLTWRDDPAAFGSFPEFFLAHEVAHQWWGQAVGWGNYHEQWLSEGFAQYFAALYAQHKRGHDVFNSIMRSMRRWSIDLSDEGPIYLGYRVGHIRNDGRAFRAIVYNKGATVLHMLRRLMGDDRFFSGLRRYYATWRFQKAGTEDFRMAMEAEAGRPLNRFFEQWIYGSTLPRLRFTHRVESGPSGEEVVLHFDQVGDLFDVPVTVTLEYANRQSTDIVVPVTDRSIDWRVALSGPLRSVGISEDDFSLANISRN